MLGIEQKKGNDDQLCGRMIAYARVPPPPPPAMCGSDTCKTYIDGVDFIDIKGVKETTNTGFVGEGYANVDNSTGSYVTYGVTAFKEGKYTLFISFANGGGSARGYSVSAGDKTLLADGSMESTAAWTTWKMQSIEIELPMGYSELKFTSLSKDGMANIDYIILLSIHHKRRHTPKNDCSHKIQPYS